jgi:hypothetical protein
MCHMLADDLVELHTMAARIGLLRKWFQPFSFPHYDVALGKRTLAIQKGAIEIDRREVAEMMRRLRGDPEFLVAWKAELDDRRYPLNARRPQIR